MEANRNWKTRKFLKEFICSVADQNLSRELIRFNFLVLIIMEREKSGT